MNRITRLCSYLGTPVDAASLAVFRVLYGLSLLAGLALLWGQLQPLYLTPKFHFSYTGFAWVPLWPGHGLQWHVVAMALCATGITLGLFYRTCCALFFAGAAYLFLLERTLYLDVLYLVLALNLLMCFVPFTTRGSSERHFVPAQRRWSLDAWRGAVIRGGTAPRWAVHSLQIILAVLMFSALLSFARVYDGAGTLASQVIAAGLQPAALILLFSAAGLLVLALPDWVYHGKQQQSAASVPEAASQEGAALPPGALAILGAFLLFHALFPLHVFFDFAGATWIDAEGKPLNARTCASIFNVRDLAGESRWNVNPNTRLSPGQVRAASADPELVLQFAHHLKDLWWRKHSTEVVVRARVSCTLDGHGYGLVLDPQRDLAQLERSDLPQAVVPFAVEMQQSSPQRFRLKRKE